MLLLQKIVGHFVLYVKGVLVTIDIVCMYMFVFVVQ